MLIFMEMVNMIAGEIKEFFKSLNLVNFASFNDLWDNYFLTNYFLTKLSCIQITGNNILKL